MTLWEIEMVLEDIRFLMQVFPYSIKRAPKHIVCDDCGTSGWGPMLNDFLWHWATPLNQQFLCQSCMEINIGRKLTSEDLRDCPMNFLHPLYQPHGRL